MSKSILVVEDDPNIAHILEFTLKRQGFAVDVSADGRAAAERIQRGTAPDLVLLDVMLPFHDGFELLAMMRAHDAWREVPVLMLSAKSQEKDIVRALSSGANDYVLKPFQPRELVARVQRMLATKR